MGRIALVRSRIIAPPSGGGVVDWTQLPLARTGGTGLAPQTIPGIAAMAANTQFNDPVSGILRAKLTSTTVPNAGNHGADYTTSGPWSGRPWVHTDGFTYYSVKLNSSWMCDVRYEDLLGFSWRQVPFGSGETQTAFAMLETEPTEMAYFISGSQVRRYNTRLMAISEASTFFPWTPSGGTQGGWLQSQRGPWIACMGGPDGNRNINALNLITGQTRNITQAAAASAIGSAVDIDEFHLDLVGPWIYLSINGPTRNHFPYNLDTGQFETPWTGQATDGSYFSDDHATPIRNGAAGSAGDPGTSPGEIWNGGSYLTMPSKSIIRYRVGQDNFTYGNEFYTDGHGNMYGNPGLVTDQWINVEQSYSDQPASPSRGGTVVGFRLGDSSPQGARFILCSGNPTGALIYDQAPRPQFSVDGKLLFHASRQHAAGNYQFFVARMPTAA